MRVVVRIELTTDWGEVTDHEVISFDRPAKSLRSDDVGLSLANGKQLLQRPQQSVVASQADEFCALHCVCSSCRQLMPIKDYQQ